MRPLLAILALLVPAGLAAAGPAPFDPVQEVAIDGKPGARVPLDSVLKDVEARPTTLSAISDGKPMLLVPVLHDCPNICGVTLSGLAQAIATQDYQPGRDFAVVAFGIDAAETPSQARAAVDELGARFPALVESGGIDAVVGNAAAVAAVTDALGYRYAWDERMGQYAHAAATAVLRADGTLVGWLYGVAPDPTDLRLALTAAGEGRIGSWTDQLLLLCYRYDPETGRYGSLVWGALRAGGIGIVAALGGFIAWSVLRERRDGRR